MPTLTPPYPLVVAHPAYPLPSSLYAPSTLWPSGLLSSVRSVWRPPSATHTSHYRYSRAHLTSTSLYYSRTHLRLGNRGALDPNANPFRKGQELGRAYDVVFSTVSRLLQRCRTRDACWCSISRQVLVGRHCGSPSLVTLLPSTIPKIWVMRTSRGLGSPACMERRKTRGPKAASMARAQGALPRPRTQSRYSTRLSERYTTHHSAPYVRILYRTLLITFCSAEP